jgi:hypothetical protein
MKPYQVNEAWVIRGRIPYSLIYWSFGAYMLSDGISEEYTPIEANINNKMVPSVKEGDDIVCIMSPNYKLSEYVANKIKHDHYNTEDKKKNVVFRYFSIPNYNANAYYNLIFNSYIHDDSSYPLFEVEQYIGYDKDAFPFYPVKPSVRMILNNKNTINECILGNGSDFIQRNLDKTLTKAKRKISLKTIGPFSQDILYLDSGTIELKNNDKIAVAAIDHSSNGKCLYSEILFIDEEDGKCYDNKIVGRYDPVKIEKTCKMRIIQTEIPASKKIRIIERICVDLSTKFRSDIDTLIGSTVYVL